MKNTIMETEEVAVAVVDDCTMMQKKAYDQFISVQSRNQWFSTISIETMYCQCMLSGFFMFTTSPSHHHPCVRCQEEKNCHRTNESLDLHKIDLDKFLFRFLLFRCVSLKVVYLCCARVCAQVFMFIVYILVEFRSCHG